MGDKMQNIKNQGIPQVLADYLSYMTVVKGKSINTVNQYCYDLKNFFKYIHCRFNSIDLSDYVLNENFDVNLLKKISLSDLYDYTAYLYNNHSNNDNYIARKVSCIKSFFTYLTIKTDILDTNPAEHLERPKIKQRLPKYLSLDESIAFLKSIDGPYKERDFAMFVIFLTCGLRVSELTGINIKDINYSQNSLRVIGKGNKERHVFLNEMCMDAIKSYLEIRPNDKLIGDARNALFISSKMTRITPRSVERICKKYFEAAGVDSSVYTPHKLRHTAATIMYRDGDVDIRTLQEILGHSNLSTTQLYTHIKNEDMKNAANNNPLTKVVIDEPDD